MMNTSMQKLGWRTISLHKGILGYCCRTSHSEAMQPTAAREKHWSMPICSDLQKQVPEGGIHWVFLGCPGVGKGTYASRLSKLLGVPHIAMGNLVRDELSSSSPSASKLEKLANEGKLLPDDVILELLTKRFAKGVQMGEKGFILDGFPRTHAQAEILDQSTTIDLAVNLRLREDVLVLKCLGRRICSGCGNNYNVTKIDLEGSDGAPRIYMPPLLPPPSCATKLTVRKDDTLEVIRERMRIYADESKPVEAYYRKQGKLLDFELSGGIPETWPRLLSALKIDAQHGFKPQNITCNKA